MNKAEFIAIIPARGGSKRLPGKNTKTLFGKPLIEWTIEAAKQCPGIQTIMVTTDDPTIASISRTAGAEVPFIRPPELSSDTAGTNEVISHTLRFYRETLNTEFEYLVLLQPTSPLRDAEDIKGAIGLLRKNQADAVVSVSPCEHSPLWSNTLPADQSFKDFLPEKWIGVRSQDLPQFYRLNGAIYICRTSAFEKHKSLFLKDSIYAYPMPVDKSVDIDTPLDFACAEFIMKERN